MKLGTLMILTAVLLFAGCATSSTRDRAFTDDWANHVRQNPGRDRRPAGTDETKQQDAAGGGLLQRDESGRASLGLGGRTGLGASVRYRRGPEGSVRYRHEFDFVRPERRR